MVRWIANSLARAAMVAPAVRLRMRAATSDGSSRRWACRPGRRIDGRRRRHMRAGSSATVWTNDEGGRKPSLKAHALLWVSQRQVLMSVDFCHATDGCGHS